MVTIDAISVSSAVEAVPVTARGRYSWLRVFAELRLRWTKRRSRLSLLELNHHQLRDIGISYEDARHEAAKAQFFQRML
ncbi:DUF1127 domain-containing protein [Rhizobium sp. 18065]|uniref:DUF1127 domain-containing protein n=1 Tax=Rhizobium sp. 18065 TaxID=2681411 RepID=UPI001356F856|nr:DUF1127 domain-containing protein [Rhizobium sp. 18065]